MTISDKAATDLRSSQSGAPPAWFRAEISRKELKALARRDDRTALLWFAGWLCCLGTVGVLAWFSLGSVWAIAAFFLYGTLYCFAEPVAHECSHGTAFRSRWLNETVYFFVCLLIFKERNYHRWMHARHHTHTIISGQDPEIQFPRPTSLLAFFLLEPFKILNAKQFVWTLISHSCGRLTDNAAKWVPQSEQRKLVIWSRVQVLFYLAVLAVIIYTQAWVAFLFLFGPRIYGGFLHNLFGSSQHAGLCDNVHDHRLNSRTIILGPVGRFLYWNMNYHLEHHMFPLVPFHALPKLHEQIKDQCPEPYQGMWQAYREMLVTVWKQQSDPDYVVRPVLPNQG